MIIYLAYAAHWIFQNITPRWYKFRLGLPFWKDTDSALLWQINKIFGFIGLIPLIVHRYILEKDNLLKAPYDEVVNGVKREKPKDYPQIRSKDSTGYGMNLKFPTTGNTDTAAGRNMPYVTKHLRNPEGAPDVQLVSQRLLAREEFKPAGAQLNIIAASWIQLMVHDWIGHKDGPETKTLAKGAVNGCPFATFKFKETEERPDGHFNSERSMWWDAGFLYGSNKEQLEYSRDQDDRKYLKVNSKYPDTLAARDDGTDLIGDQRNSWVGVSVLQELFVREHNYTARMIADANPSFEDEKVFGLTRNCIAAITAKIHTIDWTCELLKTPQLEVGMKTNWRGLLKAVFNKNFPTRFLAKTQQKKHDDKGVPFCLTEEFAAVYRLHPLSPPGLFVEQDGKDEEEFIELAETFTTKGRNLIRSSPDMPKKIMKSIYFYPCGNLASGNYPDAYRKMSPTDVFGRNKTEEWDIDLASLDLFRDRERGILPYNEFRRALRLKPFKTYEAMVGLPGTRDPAAHAAKQRDVKKLEAVYGPAPKGLEKVDLLVGDMYEGKINPDFALSETSFMIFLLMASRRLESDPFLNELWDDDHYSKVGLEHVEATEGLVDLLKRHYPDLAASFVEKGQSAFKPIYGPEAWKKASPPQKYKALENKWADTKKANDEWVNNIIGKK